MTRRTIIKPSHLSSTGRDGSIRMMRITLAWPDKFDIPPADKRDEVFISRTIRGERDWKRDPVLRHADARKDRG